MNERVRELAEILMLGDGFDASAHRQCLEQSAWLTEASACEIESLLAALADAPLPEDASARTAWEGALAVVFSRAAESLRAVSVAASGYGLPAALREAIRLLYRRLGPETEVRYYLAAMLSTAGAEEDLALLAELLVDSPPRSVAAATIPLMPLFRRDDFDPRRLFPRLLDGLENAHLAAAVLDLANDVFRRKRIETHPCAERADSVFSLFGQLVGRLGRLEEDPRRGGGTAAEIHRTVFESVALAVSLCDCVALLGDRRAIGKLHQILPLGHRRLRVEAASALYRLGEQQGLEELKALAAEPVVRLRVLRYADELGVLEQIDEKYRSDTARAEAQLASWLADPMRFGIPPGEMHCETERTLYWPGYEEPVVCRLFRFGYRLPGGRYENIAIVGPVCQTFPIDLIGLSEDDLLALFAGWHVEHDEIFEIAAVEMTEAVRAETARLERRLRDAGFDRIETVKLGFFFGEKALVAAARHGGLEGIAVVDSQREHWFPGSGGARAIGPDEAYYMYMGRKLLAAFNPDSTEER